MERKLENLFNIPISVLEKEVHTRNRLINTGAFISLISTAAGMGMLIEGGLTRNPERSILGLGIILADILPLVGLTDINNRRIDQLTNAIRIQRHGF